jgi:hypothetical protein
MIPLYLPRQRLFPGHLRNAIGIAPQPLPEGNYKLRFFFECQSENNANGYSRRVFKDADIYISPQLSEKWLSEYQSGKQNAIVIEPENVEQNLVQGRFTSFAFSVFNDTPGTVAFECKLAHNQMPENVINIKNKQFTLIPQTSRNVLCTLKIPKDLEPGTYPADIQIQYLAGGLITESNKVTKNVHLDIIVKNKI